MSDIAHIDTETEEWENTPKALRDQVKKLQKALTERDQTITEFRTQQTATALSSVLAGFKNPGRVQSALLSDSVDPLDTEAVNAWMASNGDDYARATPADPESESSEEAGAPQIPDYAALNGLQQIGTPAGADKLKEIASPPEGLGPKEMYAWLAARA